MSRFSASSFRMTRYALLLHGKPIFTGDNWHDTALAAIRIGAAAYAFGVLFTLVPGATIRPC